MLGNVQVNCPKCNQGLKVLRSGIGQYHLQCACGIVERGFSATEAANLTGLDTVRIRKIAINLMVTDVCV